MIFSANTFGLGFDSRQLHHRTEATMRNRAHRLINDRCVFFKGLTGFDSVNMVKGDRSGQLNGKSIEMYTAQRVAA